MGYVVDGLPNEFASLGEALDAAVLPAWNWRMSTAQVLTRPHVPHALVPVGSSALAPRTAGLTGGEALILAGLAAAGLYLLHKWATKDDADEPDEPEDDADEPEDEDDADEPEDEHD